MSCAHDLDAEYLYPTDVEVLDIVHGPDGAVRVELALPCPECDQPLKLTMDVVSVEETELSLPLDDAEDVYD